MKTIYTILMILLVSACASTKKDTATTLPVAPSNEVQLANSAAKYPNDTVALTKLAKIQLQRYNTDNTIFSLNKALAAYEEIFKRQPHNHEAVLQFYRLSLFKGLATKNYDIAHWQSFYQQQPFLKSIDIAPPVYMEFLLANKNNLSREDYINILQKSLKENPNFVNAYLVHSSIYAEQDKTHLALYVLETANTYSPQNTDILGPLNELRVDRIFDRSCKSDVSDALKQTFEDYKLLVKEAPENAYYHMQLSTVLRLMGRMRMSVFSAKKAASISTEFEGALAEAQFWAGNQKAITEFFEKKNIQSLDTLDLYLGMLSNLSNFNWQQSAAMAEEYITHSDISFYGVLYGAHAYKMLGEAALAQKILDQGLAKITIKPWQQHMLNFANDKISAEQLMAESENTCQQTEAYYIQGLSDLQSGNMDAFKARMNKIVDQKVYAFYEYASASHMVKRLKTKK